MSSKFFTNQDKNTLLNRLNDIFSYYDIKNIEFLIGYFRIITDTLSELLEPFSPYSDDKFKENFIKTFYVVCKEDETIQRSLLYSRFVDEVVIIEEKV